MPKWLLPTLSEILALHEPAWTANSAGWAGEVASGRRGGRAALQQVRAEREWSGAIASLSAMLQHRVDQTNSDALQGLVLSGPLPVLSQPDLVASLAARTLTVSALGGPSWLPLQLSPAREGQESIVPDSATSVLPLLPGDPLAAEQFCLALTPWFSFVVVLGESLAGEPALMFSFLPEVAQQAWQAIRPRILLMNSSQVEQLDEWVEQFPPIAPDYRTVMEFSRLLLEHLPAIESIEDSDRTPAKPKPLEEETLPQAPDVELLQAIAHEVRTPLATIRTLTRLLLKRQDLPPRRAEAPGHHRSRVQRTDRSIWADLPRRGTGNRPGAARANVSDSHPRRAGVAAEHSPLAAAGDSAQPYSGGGDAAANACGGQRSVHAGSGVDQFD